MKIAVLIPSRGRARLLSAVLTSLHELESGQHEIEYRIGVDADDEASQEVSRQFPVHLEKTSFRFQVLPPSMLTIGEIWNYLADPFRATADVYSCMIDDAVPLSPHWDRVMAALAAQGDAFSWFEVSAPQNCGYPTCTRKWLKEAGQMVPEFFPFWWMDTWFAEMVNFVTNQPVPVHQQMALFSKQAATQNMREVDFWWGFFCATRELRLKKAYKMVFPGPTTMTFEEFKASRQRFLDAGYGRDGEFRGAKIAQLEKQRGMKDEPKAKYLLAKKRATDYLETNGLTIWSGL